MRAWVLTGLVTALVLLAAGVSSAGVRICNAHADFNVSVSSARNMTCKAAASDIRAYRGSIRTHFRTPGGFACSRVGGGRLQGQWRCVKGIKAYRFEFSD